MKASSLPFAPFVVSLTLLSISARGEEPGATDVGHLELGDGYEVTVRRGEVEARYSGRLVQLTREWLVLRTVSEGRNEYGVPIVSKIPYLNRSFRNVGIGRATTDRWIRRDAAIVVGRSIADKQQSFEPLAAEEPTWKEEVRVECAVAGDVVDHSGSMTRKGETLHYVHLNMEEVETPWPVLGQLPVLGSTFTSTEIVLSEEDREVPLASVLSVVVPVLEEGEQVVSVGADFE